MKKTELADWVGEQAAARRWAPPGLSWVRPIDADGTGESEAAAGGDLPPPEATDGDNGDGTGNFEVTPAGLAALEGAAA